MKSKSIWVMEIFRKNEWFRYCDKIYTNPEEVGKAYSPLRRAMQDRGIDLRISEYRNWDFTKPYATIP